MNTLPKSTWLPQRCASEHSFSSSPSSMPSTLAYIILIACAITGVTAQFGGFFQNNFQFHNPFHQHEDRTPHRQHKGWTEMEQTSCGAGYLCPGSLACVSTPADCPCPYPEDIKCILPDPRERDEGEGPPFVCVRGSCDEVNAFSKKI
ncbi:hypothetical protein BD324DRAFT_154723 [Kockovaella imperatae]|uniref:Long chronological lifespan protein 2 n=1 Tax=Kockovaella imperatae TaxID=4999 RepID=A0A1Y1UAI0_9TREE|nr:hypothetical protein BD324DRAFT_154723 [Kockovaella imperatae]ORX34506.1 hypothetical protein BD324DRAFT_154723 [Kockovaella imperatae]